ncbi:prepilin peptidase [Pseudomonas cremoricolorata]|uniref:prepilin peptidase n=1 Tax=Pseudomonas cremoricolorata TaxID=157783 RepID=UPI000428F8A1|nr:A24 family peptidase [Pseudomonas cremoricolorata]
MALWIDLTQQAELFIVLAGVLGLLAGSFVNVVAYRLPIMLERRWANEAREVLGLPQQAHERLNLAWPGSHCPRCGEAIRAWHNIPLLSYLMLGGRCARCKARISMRYPLVELAGAVLAALVACQVGAGVPGLALMGLSWVLLALSVIDIDRQLLPDALVLPTLWLGLLLNAHGVRVPLFDAVLGAAAGYLSLWSVFWLFKLVTGKDGMGYGDFKLLALLGAWGGWQVLPLTLLLASLLGAGAGLWLLVRRGAKLGSAMAFGPCLAIAGWIVLLWDDEIRTSYLHMITL